MNFIWDKYNQSLKDDYNRFHIFVMIGIKINFNPDRNKIFFLRFYKRVRHQLDILFGV
jgi:hypothetical protein